MDGIAMDLSKGGAELFAALAKAQAGAETIGKDGKNSHGGYKYATAENVIRGARKAMAEHGLSVITTWSSDPVDPPPGAGQKDGPGQWVSARVRVDWALLHASGGVVTGSADTEAMSSRLRPPDKAVAAAVTFCHGFILRGLLNLDRAEEDEDAVDRRKDDEPWDRGQTRQQSKPSFRRDAPPHEQKPDVRRDEKVETARKAVIDLAKKVKAEAERIGWQRDLAAIASQALGKPWDAAKDKDRRYTADEYEQIRRELVLDMESITEEQQQRTKAEREMGAAQ